MGLARGLAKALTPTMPYIAGQYPTIPSPTNNPPPWPKLFCRTTGIVRRGNKSSHSRRHNPRQHGVLSHPIPSTEGIWQPDSCFLLLLYFLRFFFF